MVRAFLLLSAFLFISSAIPLAAQHLSRNPTPQQVVGYRISEQRQWDNRQLPANSVLYNTQKRQSGSLGFEYSFRKNKPALPGIPSLQMPQQTFNGGTPQPALAVQQQPHPGHLYQQWLDHTRFSNLEISPSLRRSFNKSKTRLIAVQ